LQGGWQFTIEWDIELRIIDKRKMSEIWGEERKVVVKITTKSKMCKGFRKMYNFIVKATVLVKKERS
jgi:hypothetical protein